MLLFLGLALFILLVVAHEFGHMVVAKRNGVEVEEFGIGFPPRLFAWKRRGDKTTYSVNLLPLGGFVQLKGESDMDSQKGSYGAASLKVKTKIMLAGIGMNLAIALLIFTGLALVGMPSLIEDQYGVASNAHVVKEPTNAGVVLVDQVRDGTAAAAVGVKPGDQLISIAGQAISSPGKLSKLTKELRGQSVPLVTKRADQTLTQTVQLSPEENPVNGYLGIAPISNEEGVRVTRYTWAAPVVAVGVTKQFSVMTLKGIGSALGGLGKLIAGTATGNSQARRRGGAEATSQVSGPFGLFKALKASTSLGLSVVVMFIGYISLALALMNILPIPALDGGKLFTTYSYRLLRKRLTPKAEQLIYGTSFAVLLALMLIITVFVDVKR